MGKAKEHMMELQERAAVAAALGITPEVLDDYPYQLEEPPHGSLFDARIVWDDEAPPGVPSERSGDQIFTDIEYDDEPDFPEDD